jgi:hypothetical protein
MAVVTINRHHLREVVVELCVIEQQLNVVTAICVHSNDDGARLTVGLEETTLDDVHDGVSNLGHGNIVERAVAVRVDGLTRGTVRVRSAVARGTESHRSAWHRSVVPGYGKGKFDAQIL